MATAAAVGAALVLGLAACAGAPRGPVVTRDVDIEDVTAVQLATSGDLTIRRGTTPSLTVTAREGTQEWLVSEVRDGVLVLVSRGSFGVGSWGDVELDVRTGSLAIGIEGSGGTDADRLRADEVDVSVEGSGDVEVHATRWLAVSIEGSGSVSYASDPEITQRIEGPGEVSRED